MTETRDDKTRVDRDKGWQRQGLTETRVDRDKGYQRQVMIETRVDRVKVERDKS